MSEQIVWIDIDELGIDLMNIRGGDWDYDMEFVQDIKNNGIISPLSVRTTEPSTRVKYAIYCGGRRFNGAI